MTLGDAIWSGYLTQIKYHIINDNNLYRLNGELIEKKVAYEHVVPDILFEEFETHLGERKTVVFCQSVPATKITAKAFRDRGYKAEALHYKTSNRLEVLNNFKFKDLQVLCVVSLLDEGVDVPDIGGLVNLRKTTSAVKKFQQLGRGLRLYPGKKEVIILDFVSNYETVEGLFDVKALSQVGGSRLKIILEGEAPGVLGEHPITTSITVTKDPEPARPTKYKPKKEEEEEGEEETEWNITTETLGTVLENFVVKNTPEIDLQQQVIVLRNKGFTKKGIARELGISIKKTSELLAGTAPSKIVTDRAKLTAAKSLRGRSEAQIEQILSRHPLPEDEKESLWELIHLSDHEFNKVLKKSSLRRRFNKNRRYY